MVERGRRPEVRTPPQQYAVPGATYWRYREKYRAAVREARAEAERKAYVEWQASVRKQYPASQYTIKWTDEGAIIRKKYSPFGIIQQATQYFIDYKKQVATELRKRRNEQTGMGILQYLSNWFTYRRQQVKEIEQWRQQILEQYPASRYDVTWTSTGAEIYRKPSAQALLMAQTAAQLRQWKAENLWRIGILKEYPSPQYSVKFGYGEGGQATATIYELVIQEPTTVAKPTLPATFTDVQISRVIEAQKDQVAGANIAFIPHSVVEEAKPEIHPVIGFFKWVAKGIQEVSKPAPVYDPIRYFPGRGETLQETIGKTIVNPEAPVFKALEYYVFRHERAAEEKPIRTEWEKQLTTVESQERTRVYREIELEAEKGRAEGYTEPEIQAWIKTEQARVESELLKWRGEQEPLYQKYISKWREQWRPASVAERILGIEKQIQTPSWYLPKAGILPGTTQERPLATVAGFVGSVESFVYGVESLVGIKTPRIPASPSGSVIGDIVGTVKQVTFWPETKTGYTSEMLEAYPKQYVGGGILGDIFTFWLVSKGVDKFIMQPAAVAWKGSRIDRWLADHCSWYYKRTGGIARGEVDLGQMGIREFEMPGHPLAQKSWMAGEMAWEMSLAPRTGGVMIAAPAAAKEAPEKLLPTLWIRGGVHQHITGEGWAEYAYLPKNIEIPTQELTWKGKQLIQTQPVGFARYTHRIPVFTKTYFERGILPTVVEVEKGLLPLITQAQVTRLGLIPYMGRTVTPIFVSAAPSSLSSYVFSGLSRTVAPGVSTGKKVSWPSPTLPEISLDLKPKRITDFGVTPGLELWRTLRFFESERVKRKERMVAAPTLKRPSRTALSETVFSDLDVGLELEPKEIVAQKPKEKAVAVSLLKTVLKTGTSWDQPDISQPLLPELKRKERKKKREKRKKKGVRKKQWEKYEILYPVAGAKTVAEYIFSKRKK